MINSARVYRYGMNPDGREQWYTSLYTTIQSKVEREQIRCCQTTWSWLRPSDCPFWSWPSICLQAFDLPILTQIEHNGHGVHRKLGQSLSIPHWCYLIPSDIRLALSVTEPLSNLILVSAAYSIANRFKTEIWFYRMTWITGKVIHCCSVLVRGHLSWWHKG